MGEASLQGCGSTEGVKQSFLQEAAFEFNQRRVEGRSSSLRSGQGQKQCFSDIREQNGMCGVERSDG